MIKVSQIFYLNEIGSRGNLEDSIYPLPGEADLTGRLFIVCDGVGGHNKGEVASQIVAAEVGHALRHKANVSPPDVTEALHTARHAMNDYIAIHPDAAKMSTTLTLAAIGHTSILISWCGDSRVLHIREGNILYQTRDHSLVMELVRQGQIAEEEAATHPQRNLILRSVNAEKKFTKPEFHLLTDIQDGDWLLLCTDGMFENLDADGIRAILGAASTGEQELRLAFRDLCHGRTNDNYSLYLLQLTNDTPYVAPPPGRAATGAGTRPALYLLSAILLGLVIFWGLIIFSRHHEAAAADIPAVIAAPAQMPPSVSHSTEPSFPGGDSEWIRYGRREIRYPKAALRHKLQGRATIRFLVDSAGRAGSFEPLTHLGHGLEKELQRAISMTKWIPATVGHSPIADTLTMGWQYVLPDSIGGGVHPF
jgi:protein phosphatase